MGHVNHIADRQFTLRAQGSVKRKSRRDYRAFGVMLPVLILVVCAACNKSGVRALTATAGPAEHR
jgi:hypothetical protein